MADAVERDLEHVAARVEHDAEKRQPARFDVVAEAKRGDVELDSVPLELLLWFHHVPWTERLRTGRTLWAELVHRYSAGVDSVHAMQRSWDSLEGRVDAERFREVKELLAIQAVDAKRFRDASLLYWQSFNHLPVPEGYAQPEGTLQGYVQMQRRYLPGGSSAEEESRR